MITRLGCNPPTTRSTPFWGRVQVGYDQADQKLEPANADGATPLWFTVKGNDKARVGCNCGICHPIDEHMGVCVCVVREPHNLMCPSSFLLKPTQALVGAQWGMRNGMTRRKTFQLVVSFIRGPRNGSCQNHSLLIAPARKGGFTYWCVF